MNRYWFSQKQKEQNEKHCSRSGNRKAEVLTDEGWKEYTQWCSSGDDCPWEDAALVAESKNKLPLRIDGHVQGWREGEEMQKREQLAKELAGNKTKYMEREKQREEERCLNCIHREVCDEINKLPCREQFVWYKGETGCPHHLTAEKLANAVMLAKTLFPESFGEKEISCGCKEERIVRMEEKT